MKLQQADAAKNDIKTSRCTMYPLILTARICIRFSIHNRSCYEAPFDPMHLYPKHVSLIRQWFRARLWCYRTGVTTILHLSHHHCLRESPVLVAGFTTLHTKGAWNQTCQPLRILRNHYAFPMSNTPLRKPVKNVWKLRILRNFGAIRPISYHLQQLSWPVVHRKSSAGQNIDKDLFILRLPSVSASDFAIPSTKAATEVKPCLVKRRADRKPF